VGHGLVSIVESGYLIGYNSQSLQRRFIRGFKKNLHPNTDSEIRPSGLDVLAQGFEKTTRSQVSDGGLESTDARKDKTLISSKKKKRENIRYFSDQEKKEDDER